MFSLFDKFAFYTFFNILVGFNCLIELPKFEVTDLITTEQIIRSTTNSVLSSLKLVKPLNFTRISDYATTLHYFLSLTFRDSEVLNEIARLTRVDKGSNKTEENLTTILNELLDEDSFEFKTNDVVIDDSDASVANYINGFLAKLEELKESFGVNKVFSDINVNIIKIFRIANETFTENSENVHLANGTGESFNVFDSGELWQESGRRIFKGKRTKIKYFPFMASVHIFNSFQCAGSIIKSDLVITASSCLQLAWNNRLYRENPAFLSVRVGSSFYKGGGESIPVLEIYFHPEYNPKNLRNNICLMRLVRHIKFRYSDKRKVRKIAIDDQASNLPVNIPGITILGWGAKGLGGRLGNPWDNILSYAFLDVYPLRECQEVFTKEYVTNKNFCGGFFSKGGGACNRDVGGPGVVDGRLMGVVSFGSPECGTPDVPTVFTKLGYYYDWIENIMELDVPRGLRGSTLQNLRDPYDPFMTTPYTTTTFRIEPLGPHSKPKSALLEDKENLLRNLDGNLFQDFLRTMFGEDESQKYEYLIDQMKKKQLVAEMKQQYKEMKETGRENKEDGSKANEVFQQSQISKPDNDKEHAIGEPYQPLTSRYDSENYLYPSTALMFTDKGKVTEDDYPVTEMIHTSSQTELYYEKPEEKTTLEQPELYYEAPETKITHGQPELYFETPVTEDTLAQPEYYEAPVTMVTMEQTELYSDTPFIKSTHGQANGETKFIRMTQHGKDIGRNVEISFAPIKNTKASQSTTTTKLPAQIELELAMESSDDESDDSSQIISDDKNVQSPIKGIAKESLSADISDIPEEDALTKLLNEIDLDQIIKEVSMDTKQLQPENKPMSKPKSPGSLFVPAPTTLAPKHSKVKNKVPNYKDIGRLGKNFNESVLTLLYLTDTERQNNFHVDSRNFIPNIKKNIAHHTTLNHLAPSESIYKVVPKSNVYKIISDVLNAAIDNKKKV